jgi:glycosyltransferase involved in cell wall biosynthesis
MASVDGVRRVLVVVTHPLGGIRTYLLYNLASMLEKGYAFTFLAPGGEAFEAFKQDTAKWPGVGYVDAPIRDRKSLMRGAIRRAVQCTQFSLIHSQGLKAGLDTSLATLGLRVPQVITLHDVIVPQNEVPGRMKWLKKRVIGRLTARADAIIAVSHDCRANHLEQFPEWERGCRVEVICNGVDIAGLVAGVAVGEKASVLRRKLALPEKAIIAGFLGRFMPQKGFLVLLGALRQLASRGFGEKVCLVAAKDPHGYCREHMREVEQDEVLSRMIYFVEPVSEIAPLLSQMDMLVMPSLWEACPLLPMESMVLGIPVVGSDAIGLREVLRDTPSLTPAAGNATALAHAIEKMCEPRHRQCAAAFVSVARERFDNRQSAAALADIYATIV